MGAEKVQLSRESDREKKPASIFRYTQPLFLKPHKQGKDQPLLCPHRAEVAGAESA